MPWANKRRNRTSRSQDEVMTLSDVRDYSASD